MDRRASSRVHVTRAPMAAWPFSHHLGQNGLTNWAGSWGAGPPVRGQCWLPWGWECVRLKVLGWPPPCLVPDTTPVVTQWHLRGGECPAPQQWKIRTTLLGAFRIAGSGLWPGGQHTHSTHWTLGMDTRSLSLGGPGTGGEVGRLQVDTSGPHLCVDSCGAGRRFTTTVWGQPGAGTELAGSVLQRGPLGGRGHKLCVLCCCGREDLGGPVAEVGPSLTSAPGTPSEVWTKPSVQSTGGW